MPSKIFPFSLALPPPYLPYLFLTPTTSFSHTYHNHRSGHDIFWPETSTVSLKMPGKPTFSWLVLFSIFQPRCFSWAPDSQIRLPSGHFHLSALWAFQTQNLEKMKNSAAFSLSSFFSCILHPQLSASHLVQQKALVWFLSILFPLYILHFH